MSMTLSPTERSPQAAPAMAVAAAAQAAPAAATPAVQAPEPKFKAPDPEETRQALREAVERLNEFMKKQSRNLSFSVDERVDRTVITVKDTHTGDVVRQIPDETLLKVAHSIEDFKGLLHNEFI